MAFLECQKVSKGFGQGADRIEVLRDIQLRVDEGEFLAILGYSGSGKTTLMSMLAGLFSPDTGSISMDGKPIVGPAADRGIVFQNYSLLPWLTAYENVALAVDQIYSHWSVEQKRLWVQQYLERVNLGQAGEKRPHELSGGMRQRVAVARALAMDPRVLLLDEPFGALDALTRATLQTEIERIFLAEKKTIILVTNNMDEALLLADRIVPLSMGPNASFGPEWKVTAPRPRNRVDLDRDLELRKVRHALVAYLLGPGRRQRGPNIEPLETEKPDVPWVAAVS
jgi:nitrate/nitrite transport system ATP-binding protein